MKLRTPRLSLEPVTLDDVDDWHDLDQQPGVLDFLPGDPRSRDQVADSIRRATVISQLHHDYGFFTARLVDDGCFVGWFHLRPGPDGDIFNPELGYRLRPERWGQGLATEGSRALVDAAFNGLGAASVVAETLRENLSSRRVMIKLGMTLTGDGADEVVRYRIRMTDWLDAHIDVRTLLHGLQATAVKQADRDQLDRLRSVGMAMARAERDGHRASDDFLAALAGQFGVEFPGQ
ncbi:MULTISPECIES: GNAT family N-acetyltransferase [unclassified Luteococcus]|uniref:GNAT family N-acetyltransferase n=1 Tax=unclassified Luteococcus TaxID=2639923 RepID=UPI00313E301C